MGAAPVAAASSVGGGTSTASMISALVKLLGAIGGGSGSGGGAGGGLGGGLAGAGGGFGGPSGRPAGFENFVVPSKITESLFPGSPTTLSGHGPFTMGPGIPAKWAEKKRQLDKVTQRRNELAAISNIIESLRVNDVFGKLGRAGGGLISRVSSPTGRFNEAYLGPAADAAIANNPDIF